MKKLSVFFAVALFSPFALADMDVNQWLDLQADRGAQIELIRVANDKALVAVQETDAEIENILTEVKELENEASEEVGGENTP